jgi:hypothetical protein
VNTKTIEQAKSNSKKRWEDYARRGRRKPSSPSSSRHAMIVSRMRSTFLTEAQHKTDWEAGINDPQHLLMSALPMSPAGKPRDCHPSALSVHFTTCEARWRRSFQ